jgi:hypothetical protein
VLAAQALAEFPVALLTGGCETSNASLSGNRAPAG